MTFRDILLTLPETMHLKEALDEADRIKAEKILRKSREDSNEYRKSHLEYRALKNREYRARKKEKLQAEAKK